MTFAWRQNCLMTQFSEYIPVIKWRVPVLPLTEGFWICGTFKCSPWPNSVRCSVWRNKGPDVVPWLALKEFLEWVASSDWLSLNWGIPTVSVCVYSYTTKCAPGRIWFFWNLTVSVFFARWYCPFLEYQLFNECLQELMERWRWWLRWLSHHPQVHIRQVAKLH
jgi:hypothetical protein